MIQSFRFCQQNQGLIVHAWVLMPNHYHMILSVKEGSDPGLVIKNSKSYTAIKIIDSIINHPEESRREWMLEVFEKKGKQNKNNFRFQFWQHENHPFLLDSMKLYRQRLNYLHENPVRAGFVYEPQEWKYGSGIDYYTAKGKGMLPIEFLD